MTSTRFLRIYQGDLIFNRDIESVVITTCKFVPPQQQPWSLQVYTPPFDPYVRGAISYNDDMILATLTRRGSLITTKVCVDIVS